MPRSVSRIIMEKDYFSKKMTRSTKTPLKKAGSLVQRYAKRSIKQSRAKVRSKGKSSKPGEPPRSHHKPPLIKRIYFALESRRKDTQVLIGPTSLFGDSKPVPHILEYGGSTVIKYRSKISRGRGRRKGSNQNASSGRRARTSKQRRSAQKAYRAGKLNESHDRRTEAIPTKLHRKRVRIKPRPFMRPAYYKHKRVINRLFIDFITRSGVYKTRIKPDFSSHQ